MKQIHHGSGRTEFCPDEAHVFSLAGMNYIALRKEVEVQTNTLTNL